MWLAPHNTLRYQIWVIVFVHAQWNKVLRPRVSMACCLIAISFRREYNINISIIIHFKQYLPSSIQPAMFTGCVARQTNHLYVLCMIVKLAYCSYLIMCIFGSLKQIRKLLFWV